MIQLRRAGLVADKEDVERHRIEFAKAHWVRLPSLLDQALLSRAISDIERGNWREGGVPGFYSESILESGPAVSLLRFVSNTPRFLKIISKITGCDSLTWFDGRVYRMQSNELSIPVVFSSRSVLGVPSFACIQLHSQPPLR
jgi:hypothetical protein